MLKIRPIFRISLFVAIAIHLGAILFYLSSEYVEDSNRTREIMDLAQEFDGVFSIAPVHGKFDGVRLSGSIRNNVEFEELCAAIREAQLSFNVSVRLNSGENVFSVDLFKGDAVQRLSEDRNEQ